MFTVSTTNHNIKQYRQLTCNPSIEASSRNYFAVENQ
jgi:hypothetical protein